MRLVCIDPGQCSGVALFEGRDLVNCVLVEPGQITPGWGADVLVIEHPTLEPGDLRAKSLSHVAALAKDLASVNVIEGRWIQAVSSRTTVQVSPHRWKGSVPKGIHNARVLGRLTPAELRLVPTGAKRHNAIDAIGIGLWYLNRGGQ